LDVKLTNIKEVQNQNDTRECSNAIMKTQFQKADITVDTLGFYEFLDHTTLEEGTFVYRTLPQNQKEKISRKYYNTRILRLEIKPKDAEVIKKMQNGEHDKIACTFAFLVNEVFETLLDENVNYIISKAVVSNGELLNDTALNLYRPILDENVDTSSIVLYISEDLKISKGLLSSIENEMIRILSILKKYLTWCEALEENNFKYVKGIDKNDVFTFNVINQIIPNTLS
jgi:hypothetical protein